MNSWDGANRRKFPRVNFPCLIVLRHQQNAPEVILTHTENIGVGGVSVVIKRSISLFAPVELEIDLLDAGNHIKCSGKVVWSVRRKLSEKQKPLFYDLGIEFLEMTATEYKRLDDIVNRLMRVDRSVLKN